MQKNKIKLLINNRRLERYILAKKLINNPKKRQIIYINAKSSSGLHSIEFI